MKKTIDSRSFRQIMGCFATGIAVATAHHKECGAFGLTINSLTSVSLKPPLALFCLDKSVSLYPYFRHVRFFALNFLSAEQEDVSRHFADRHNHPAPQNLWDKPIQKCPILRGTLGWALCRPQAFYKGGDHTIIVGEVIDLQKRSASKKPLLYFHGHYRKLAN